MRVLTALILLLIALPASSTAQVLVRRPPPSAAPAPASGNVPASATAGSQTVTAPSTADSLLTQAGVSIGEDSSTVSLQAFEFFTSQNTRFYLRSTLPLTSEPAAEPGAAPAGALRDGILDPFGGLLNASLGAVYPRGGASALSLDARTGLKLLEVPKPAEEGSDAPAEFDKKPFFTAMVMAKARINLRRDLAEDPAGTLTLAAGINVTAAGSKSYLQSLTGVDRTTVNISVHSAIDLPGVFYITVEGAPWSSNDGLGKRFVFSVNAMKK